MTKPLKVAYFAFSEPYGGEHAGFTHTFNIVKSLAVLHLKIKAFLYSEKRIEDKNNLEFIGVVFPNLRNLFRVNPLKYFASYFKVLRKTNDVDLIHERFHINPIDLFFIRKKPYVLEVNDPAMVLHDNFLYKFFINLKFRRCDCIITQTKTLKNILSKYTNKPIYVVSNGVDTSKFKPNIKNEIRKKYKIAKNEVLIFFHGGFMQWHGVLDIIRLAENFPKVKFLMVGNGPEFENVRKESKSLKNLILAGSKPKDEIPGFLSACDIAIAPFNTKKFKKIDEYGFWWCPIKLFEYLAAGKAVVSYDYPEVRNIVKTGGLLAKPGDFKDFNDQLRKLINNKSLRDKVGRRARKIALDYDWKYRAKETLEVYKKCLEE